MVVTLQNHSGILNSTTGINAAEPQHTLLFICPHCAHTLALTLRVSLTSVLNSDPPESDALQPACQLQLSSVPEHMLDLPPEDCSLSVTSTPESTSDPDRSSADDISSNANSSHCFSRRLFGNTPPTTHHSVIPLKICSESMTTNRRPPWSGCGLGYASLVDTMVFGCVCSVRAVCKSVVLGGKWGKGRLGGHPLGLGCQPTSSCGTPSHSAYWCWCRHSSCNTHAIVLFGPRRAFSNVARALAWAYPDPDGRPDDVAEELRPGATVEMAYTTCMPQTWEAAVWPPPRL